MVDRALRHWLSRHPRPITIRARIDGDQRIITLGAGKARWRDAESACHGADRLEALDQVGNVLRVWVAPEHENDDETPDFEPSPAAEAPKTTMSELATLASIITTSNDQAVKRHSEAFTMAYRTQTDLMKMMTQQLGSLQTLIHETIVERRREADDALEDARAVRDEADAIREEAEKNAANAGESQVVGLLKQVVPIALANAGNGKG